MRFVCNTSPSEWFPQPKLPNYVHLCAWFAIWKTWHRFDCMHATAWRHSDTDDVWEVLAMRHLRDCACAYVHVLSHVVICPGYSYDFKTDFIFKKQSYLIRLPLPSVSLATIISSRWTWLKPNFKYQSDINAICFCQTFDLYLYSVQSYLIFLIFPRILGFLLIVALTIGPTIG